VLRLQLCEGATIKSYLSWFKNILDLNIDNSVASYVRDKTKALSDSDNSLLNGIFGPSVKTPGIRQAIYGLENQVDTPTLDKTRPWYRVYALSTLLRDDGDQVWKLQLNVSPKFEYETYARESSAFQRETDNWYSPRGNLRMLSRLITLTAATRSASMARLQGKESVIL
jgi:hypothetical protein